MAIRPFQGKRPSLHPTCFVEDSAQLVGDVTLGEGSSVWFNTVIRADVGAVKIGCRTNIQDLCMVHVHSDGFGTSVGDDVTVGHHVVLHGCTIGNRVLIGIGAILMDGVEVGDDCIVGAGALLVAGTKIPAGSLALGSPAKVKRPLTPEERDGILKSARSYVGYAKAHRSSDT